MRVSIGEARRRLLALGLALCFVLLASAICGAWSSRPITPDKSGAVSLASAPSDLNLDDSAEGSDSVERSANSGAQTWVPETEVEHPMHHFHAEISWHEPILHSGRRYYGDHPDWSDHTPSPVTPPPNRA